MKLVETTDGTEVIVQPAGSELAQQDGRAWEKAAEAWLNAKERRSGSRHTRRTYKTALRQWSDFLAGYGRHPSEAGGVEVEAWISRMEAEDKAEATIAARLAAVSSFYDYCQTKFTLQGPDGRERTLIDYNPMDRAERPQVDPYAHANKVNPSEVPAILAQPGRSTIQGRRDYSILLAFVFTGRRLAELARLRWGDVERTEHRVAYHYRGKGGKERTRELPPPVWAALETYLERSGRLEDMKADSPLWTAHSDAGRYLPTTPDEAPEQDEPLSPAMIGRLIHKYGRHALDREISPHSLRHAAAMLRSEAGDDIRTLQGFLDHEHVNTTQIYMESLEVAEDTSWRKVERLIEQYG